MTTHIHIPAPLEEIAEEVEAFIAKLRGLGHEPVVAEAPVDQTITVGTGSGAVVTPASLASPNVLEVSGS